MLINSIYFDGKCNILRIVHYFIVLVILVFQLLASSGAWAQGHVCELIHPPSVAQNSSFSSSAIRARQVAPVFHSSSLKTYRIAIAATGEFAQINGGTKTTVMAVIQSVIERINIIFKRDLGIELILVENNDSLVFTDPNTDPYYKNNNTQNLDINQSVLDSRIGSSEYDIGHLFHYISQVRLNGLASIASTCNDAVKAKGMVASIGIVDDRFISMVAHEIGHQLGATHTFNSNTGACSNRHASTAYEPGGGTSIMSYMGGCGDNDVQDENDLFFHSASIQQIVAATQDQNGVGQCATQLDTDSTNHAPIPHTGKHYTIPARTPFVLQGNALDVNQEDNLTYSWEQWNVDPVASDVDIDTGNNAILRIYPPTASPDRVIPKLDSLLQGISVKGELLPQQSRLNTPLKMGLVVRDQKGGISLETTSINVKDTGSAFEVTSQSTEQTLTTGKPLLVTWNTADTVSAPISCPLVDISLMDFSQSRSMQGVLLATVENNGMATVTIPLDSPYTSMARIMVQCRDNLFFALSGADLTLQSEANRSTTPTFHIPHKKMIEGDEGARALEFTLNMHPVKTTSQTVYYSTNLYAGDDETITAASEDDFKRISSDTQLRGLGVVFEPGETTKTVSIELYPDVDEEAHESFDFILYNEQFDVLAKSLGTILDDDAVDDPVASVTIANSSVLEGQSSELGQAGNVAWVPVYINPPQSNDVMVDFVTSDYPDRHENAARANIDYVAKQGSVTISAGETVGYIGIDIIGDALVGSDEYFKVTLSNPSINATLINTVTEVKIINDDYLAPVSVSVNGGTIEEGNGDTGNKQLRFTVLMEKAVSYPVMMNFSTEPDSATAGDDYIAKSGAVVFEAGEVQEDIWITIVGDTDFEDNESFLLKLSGTSQGVALQSSGTATGQITNDDIKPEPVVTAEGGGESENTQEIALSNKGSGGGGFNIGHLLILMLLYQVLSARRRSS